MVIYLVYIPDYNTKTYKKSFVLRSLYNEHHYSPRMVGEIKEKKIFKVLFTGFGFCLAHALVAYLYCLLFGCVFLILFSTIGLCLNVIMFILSCLYDFYNTYFMYYYVRLSHILKHYVMLLPNWCICTISNAPVPHS